MTSSKSTGERGKDGQCLSFALSSSSAYPQQSTFSSSSSSSPSQKKWKWEKWKETMEVVSPLLVPFGTICGSTLFSSIARKNLRDLRLLLMMGADVNLKLSSVSSSATAEGHQGREEGEEGGSGVEKWMEGYAPLHLAVYSGLLPFIRSLLEAGADINSEDEDGRGPLHFACAYSKEESAKILLSRGAKVNLASKDGASPFVLACKLGKEAVATRFAQLTTGQGEYMDRDQHGNTPFLLACKHGKEGAAVALAKAGADVRDGITEGELAGWTCVHFAAQFGLLTLAKAARSRGADVNAQLKDKRRPLHLACNKRHENVATFLIANGADVAATDENGESCLHVAAKRGLSTLVRSLVQRGVDVNAVERKTLSTALHFACGEGLEDAVPPPSLPASHPLSSSTNTTAASSRTSAQPHFQPFQTLTSPSSSLHISSSHPASPTSATGSFTALTLSSPHPTLDPKSKLTQGSQQQPQTPRGGGAGGGGAGASSSSAETVTDTEGYPSGRPFGKFGSCLVELLNAGANVNVKDKVGHTPLHVAAFGFLTARRRAAVGRPNEEGDDEEPERVVAATLLHRGADEGMSPLLTALRSKREKVTAALAAAGADVSVTVAKNGWSPLHYAAHGHLSNATFALLRWGASLDARDALGRTALHVACEVGAEEVALLLLANGADSVSHAYDGKGREVPSSSSSSSSRRLLISRSPLHTATERSLTRVVQALILRGADPEDLDEVAGQRRQKEPDKRGTLLFAFCCVEKGSGKAG
eukprot:Cvel_627.t2-p1 / transcript=Cvel_627.t2 / gene=Cvel_627 / organism=Chromera_velia_CCMP2878 / gene_product=Neurogenic locus notch homolog protein 4, putative / transcript_product=Neurogenic locus notch homolog protein 4, putative / location=Cvel_scaffold19:97701-108905(+) / protein_length=760 / sequence_SO=supercontig / SO=protein_coding / is_pseudo=false